MAGLFSFGVLITNFAATFLCFSTLIFSLKSDKRIRTILEYGGTVISLGFFLNIFQKVALKGQYFFIPNTVTTELNYVKTTLLNNPLLVLKEIMSNFLLVNFISPSPFVNRNTDRLGSVNLSFFERSSTYSILGWSALALWIILFFWGFYRNIICQQKLSKNFLVAIGLAIFSNVALHSFFGVEEMFIYATNFSLPVLLLAVNQSIVNTRLWKLSLASLILLMGINNLNIMREIILALKT